MSNPTGQMCHFETQNEVDAATSWFQTNVPSGTSSYEFDTEQNKYAFKFYCDLTDALAFYNAHPNAI